MAGLWEFPSIELSSLDTKYAGRSLETTDYLKTKYNVELQECVRHDLGNVVHLFSHIRKVYHIEWIQFKSEEKFKETDEIKWVTMSELLKAPIPTGLKKAIKLFEKFKVRTKIFLITAT